MVSVVTVGLAYDLLYKVPLADAATATAADSLIRSICLQFGIWPRHLHWLDEVLPLYGESEMHYYVLRELSLP